MKKFVLSLILLSLVQFVEGEIIKNEDEFVHHIVRRETKNEAGEVDNGNRCNKTCIMVVVGCVLAIFVLLLLGSLCYALCNHTVGRSRKTLSIKNLSSLDENTISPVPKGDPVTSLSSFTSIGGYYNQSYDNDIFVDTTLPSRKQGVRLPHLRSGTLPSNNYRAGTLPQYLSNGSDNERHYQSDADIAYDIPLDSSIEGDTISEVNIRRLGGGYKMTIPSSYYKDSDVEIDIPDPLLSESSPPISEGIDINDEGINIPVIHVETKDNNKNEEQINIQVLDQVDKDESRINGVNGVKPRHLEEAVLKPRKLGNRKFEGSRKFLGSIKSIGSKKKKSMKAYGDRLVLNRKLFGFASFKTQHQKEEMEERDEVHPEKSEENEEKGVPSPYIIPNTQKDAILEKPKVDMPVPQEKILSSSLTVNILGPSEKLKSKKPEKNNNVFSDTEPPEQIFLNVQNPSPEIKKVPHSTEELVPMPQPNYARTVVMPTKEFEIEGDDTLKRENDKIFSRHDEQSDMLESNHKVTDIIRQLEDLDRF